MLTITKSIRIIDYEGNNVYTRETPAAFDAYVTELISHVGGNTAVREFKTRSAETEVIGCIRQILLQRADNDIVIAKTDIIAQRLLAKEIEAQQKVARLDTNVQKGSLIQALLYDEESEIFTYLLAKVEHSDFVDETDFTFRSGFSKDKKTFWKSCLIDLPNVEATEYYSKIYSNTVAKYWSDDFLELDEMVSDESNTSTAFKAIEGSLNRNVRGIAPRDHTIIRNAIISYFKNHEHFDYNQMVDSVLGEYHTTDLPQDKLDSLKAKLKLLPDQKHFERQFNSVPSVINARIKSLYDVNNGIQIKITDEIRDIEETIYAFREDDGTRYIKIKTNNDLTFKRFCKPD